MNQSSLTKCCALMGLGVMLVSSFPALHSPAIAQEDSQEEQNSDLEMTIELYSTIMSKAFEKADIEDAQMEKIKEVIDRSIPELVKTRHRLEGMLTAQQKKTYGAAVRQAVQAKYNQAEAEEFALRKLNLATDKLSQYKAAKAKVDEINNQMNDSIAALLTDEQKSRLPMFAARQPKLATYKIQFPGMKTEEDGKKIEELLQSIKGAKVSELNLPTQAIRIDLPDGTNLDAEMEKLIKAENEILAGWKRMRVGNVIRSGPAPGSKVTPDNDSQGNDSQDNDS